MTLKLIAIGGFGSMLSPSARHLHNSPNAQFIRVLDRGKTGDKVDYIRTQWQRHGATLVNSLSDLVGDGDFDGVVICTGKNGDDYAIFCDLIPLLNAFASRRFFIVHFSTVSPPFVTATHTYCAKYAIDYVNYPLTGGVLGAHHGTMLILASGDKLLYEKLHPMLSEIGSPKYFGEEITLAACVKLIGHVMVFHNLLGLSIAVELQEAVFANDSHHDRIAFFNFLNQGAGGSHQWNDIFRNALAHQNWHDGFRLVHASVDLIYTLQLMEAKKMAAHLSWPLKIVSLLFSYAMHNFNNEDLSTQTISRLLYSESPSAIDAYIQKYATPHLSVQNCIDALPPALQQSLMPDVSYLG